MSVDPGAQEIAIDVNVDNERDRPIGVGKVLLRLPAEEGGGASEKSTEINRLNFDRR